MTVRGLVVVSIAGLIVCCWQEVAVVSGETERSD